MPEQDDVVYFIDPESMNTVAEVKKPIKSPSKYFADTTGMSYYDGILHYPKYHRANKGVRAYVEMISPEKYFEEAAKVRRGNGAIEDEYMSTGHRRSLIYADRTRKGSKMPIPVIDYAHHSQEGRHRAMAAMKLKLHKIPVLFVDEV